MLVGLSPRAQLEEAWSDVKDTQREVGMTTGRVRVG
jgi:hypothetical protein